MQYLSTEKPKKEPEKSQREKKSARKTVLFQTDEERRREELRKFKIPKLGSGKTGTERRSVTSSSSSTAAAGSAKDLPTLPEKSAAKGGASANPESDEEEPQPSKTLGVVSADGSTIRKYVQLKKGLKVVLYHSNALIASKLTHHLEKTDREAFIRNMVRNTWHAKHSQMKTLQRPSKLELDEMSLHLATEYDILRDTNKLEGEKFYETLAFDMNRRLTNECYELGRKGLLVPKVVQEDATEEELEALEASQRQHERRKKRSGSFESSSMNVLCFIVFVSS